MTWRVALGLMALPLILGVMALLGSDRHAPEPTPASASLFEALASSGGDNFSRIPVSPEFQFPRDHGSHLDYRTEWWLVTAMLKDEQERRLGVQLAFFRVGLATKADGRASRWAVSDLYAAIFSISNPVTGTLISRGRLSRAPLGPAGAAAEPMQVWVENWQLEQIGGDSPGVDLRARVKADEVELLIELENHQPLTTSNEFQSREAGVDAPFQFYIQPRLKVTGSYWLDGRRWAVSGTGAIEHAWGELPLPGGAVARDRFMVHFEDSRALYCVRLHREDQSGTGRSNCLLFGLEAAPRAIPNSAIELKPAAEWRSNRTDVRYPTHWTLEIPDEDIHLKLLPHWDDQEGDTWLSFWSGPMRVEGIAAKPELRGEAFVQLTGY